MQATLCQPGASDADYSKRETLNKALCKKVCIKRGLLVIRCTYCAAQQPIKLRLPIVAINASGLLALPWRQHAA
jgi:hypothetical protein